MSESPNVLEYFDNHYLPEKGKKLSASHVKNLRTGIKKFCLFMPEVPTVEDITPEAVEEFRTALIEAGQAKNKVSDYYRIIIRIYRHAKPEEYGAQEWPEYQSGKTCGIRKIDIPAEPGSLREFFRNVYKPLKLRGKTDNGIRLHEITLNNFALFLKREPMFSDATSEVISWFLSWLRDRGRTAATANDNRNRLMALIRFAVKKHLIEEEPIVEPEIEPERSPRAWTESDLEVLFTACASQTGTVGGIPAALWWSTLHLVALFTGERIGALLSIRWEQFDATTGWLAATAEQRKGKRSDKEWPLPPEAVEALLRLKSRSNGELIFPWPQSVATLYNHYKRLLSDAGLPTDRISKFHRIRKSTASHFASKGGNATELLGHSSARVTKAYLDRRIVKDVAAMELISVPLAASSMFAAGCR